MKKRIAIIASHSHSAQVAYQQIKAIFQDHVEIKSYSFEENNISQAIGADLWVTPIDLVYITASKYLPKGTPLVIKSVTLTKMQFEEVAKLPTGTTALLVNYSIESAMDTISLFHQLGINHVEFVPETPDTAGTAGYETIITMGESISAPSSIKTLLDIGDRVIDDNTIIDIATKLKLKYLLNENIITDYFKSIKTREANLIPLLGQISILESQLLGVLNVMDDGIIVSNDVGIIRASNQKAQEILGEKSSLTQRKIENLIPQIPFSKVFETSQEIGYNLIKINKCNISVKVVPLVAAGKISSVLTILNKFDEREKNQHRLRMQLIGKGHQAKYTFDNIITKDSSFMNLKKLAEKYAFSEASIVIIGESGTGKELFAQAIHNASKRRNWQFIAINCAALPESLLESELFGYEEGAFTGAKKGGKIGLFELAHKGTLFLDEIGEINLNLQARLLRVLEAREVMRIGGDSVIPVDIRIIAATNRDLWSLMEEGLFRKDLYYRLNVLPLVIFPLRERKCDILFVMEHMKKARGATFTLSEEAATIFAHYPWPGNLRELKNCVEYLVNLGKDIVDANDLVHIIKKMALKDNVLEEWLSVFLNEVGTDRELYVFILECLYNSYNQRLRIGRRSLVNLAQKNGYFLTEAHIRKMFILLERHAFIKTLSGRGGTTITTLGIQAFKLLTL